VEYGDYIALLSDSCGQAAYIADAESQELLFLSRPAMELFDIRSEEEYLGQTCCRLVCGQTLPCGACTRQEDAAPGEVVPHEIFNPTLKKVLRMRSVGMEAEGRKLRGGWITASAEGFDDPALESVLELEEILLVCIRTLALEEDSNIAINLFLQYIGTFYQADRAYILETDEALGLAHNTYEWCAWGVDSVRESLQNLPLAEVTERLGDCWTPEGNRLLVPLYREGDMLGYLGVSGIQAHQRDAILLHLSSDLIAEEFCKRSMLWDMESQEHTDRLTGLQNRNKYRLALEGFRLDPPKSMGVMFLDLNGLKELNDHHGHDAGDRFICRCADILNELRLNAFRVDGDEFVILSPDIDEAGFRADEERLREALKALKPHTVSVGSCWEEGQIDVHAMVAQTDELMYAEKQVYYRNVLQQERVYRTGIASDVLREIRESGFVVFYQPQVDLHSGAIYGAEALVRKRGADGSLIPPDRFVPFYEAEGVISHMDFNVLEQVCANLARWREELGCIPKISVNFSRVTLMEPDVVPRICEICGRFDIPRSAIMVEVTESAGKLSHEQLNLLVTGLQNAGFAVSLDDFGSRYSNLSILTFIDFQLIKLDKSLVDRIQSGEVNRNVVRDLIHLCRDTLHTKVLAEGVETAEQTALLRDFACDYVQGYHFSRPVSVECFTEMLRVGSWELT